MHLSADDFLPALLKICSGSPWLLFRGVERIQTCDKFNHNPDLGLSNVSWREGCRSSRDKLLSLSGISSSFLEFIEVGVPHLAQPFTHFLLSCLQVMFFPLTPLTSSVQLLNYDQWSFLPFPLGHLLSFSPFTLQFSRECTCTNTLQEVWKFKTCNAIWPANIRNQSSSLLPG